jgi:hypothetical protein
MESSFKRNKISVNLFESGSFEFSNLLAWRLYLSWALLPVIMAKNQVHPAI